MKPKRIMLPLVGAAIDADVIALAATVAKPAKAQVVAVHVIEVKWHLPLDAVLEDEMARGEEILSGAEDAARRAGITLETELVQARTAWSAIVDTAQQRDADLIIIGMPYRKRMGRVMVGTTLQNVFLGAPCQVIAVRERAPDRVTA